MRRVCLQGWPLAGIWELGFWNDSSIAIDKIVPVCLDYFYIEVYGILAVVARQGMTT